MEWLADKNAVDNVRGVFSLCTNKKHKKILNAWIMSLDCITQEQKDKLLKQKPTFKAWTRYAFYSGIKGINPFQMNKHQFRMVKNHRNNIAGILATDSRLKSGRLEKTYTQNEELEYCPSTRSVEVRFAGLKVPICKLSDKSESDMEHELKITTNDMIFFKKTYGSQWKEKYIEFNSEKEKQKIQKKKENKLIAKALK